MTVFLLSFLSSVACFLPAGQTEVPGRTVKAKTRSVFGRVSGIKGLKTIGCNFNLAAVSVAARQKGFAASLPMVQVRQSPVRQV